MSKPLDELMEQASQALAQMNYLGCEALCEEALSQALAANNWEYFARVLLPLQEARRQRRMIAAEGTIRLGSQGLVGDAQSMLTRAPTGCVALTRPHTAKDALELQALARQQRRYVEVLWADNTSDARTWMVRSISGSTPVSCSVDAPPSEWIDRWIDPNSNIGTRVSNHQHPTKPVASAKQPAKTPLTTPGTRPADWFIDASERLGNAALEAARFSSGDDQVRFRMLRSCLDVVHDHELIHQALAEAARRLARGK